MEVIPQERKALFGMGEVGSMAKALVNVEKRVYEVGDKIMTHNQALHEGTRREI